MGAGLRPRAKARDLPPDPTVCSGSALDGNIRRERAEVSRGHSSQMPRCNGGDRVKDRTRGSREEPSGLDRVMNPTG